MPFVDPQAKKDYDRKRRALLAEQIRERSRTYVQAHREQKRKYDRDRYPEVGERRRAQARERWSKLDKKSTAAAQRAYTLKRNYGLTVEQWEALLVSQSGRCGLCQGALGARIHVDHDHQTGKTRSLLHSYCNTALAPIENKSFLAQALAYLESHAQL